MNRYGIDSEAKPSLPIANSVMAEKGMAGGNPPLKRLPAKSEPIPDSLDGHYGFRLRAPAEGIVLPSLDNHRREWALRPAVESERFCSMIERAFVSFVIITGVELTELAIKRL